MIEGIEIWKKAITKHVNTILGRGNVSSYFGRHTLTHNPHALMKSPSSSTITMQDLDPASSTFGEIYYMPDIDGVDVRVIL